MRDNEHSWDLKESNKGNLTIDVSVWDRIYEEWMKRDWMAWLKSKLTFPFEVERKEDDDDAYFTDVAKFKPFRLGHSMQAIGLEKEFDRSGILIKVEEGRKIGYVPLCDVEVTSKKNNNYWPVREYVVWFANS